MKCYTHREKDAIGVCNICFKAVCEECGREVEGRVICKSCLERLRRKEEKRKEEERRAAEEEMKRKVREELQIGGRVSLYEKWMRKIFPHARLKEKEVSTAGIITPIFFGGVIAGILAGIPVFNLLSPLILLFGSGLAIIFVRAEGFFETAVRPKDGAKIGFFVGIIATFVSTLILLTLEVFFAPAAFRVAASSLEFFAPRDIDMLLKIVGLDKDLSLFVFQLRFFTSLILFPLIGAIGGWIAAKRMR